MCAHDHLGLGVELVDANLTEAIVVEASGGSKGGETPHKVARVNAEDVHHGDVADHGQPDALKIVPVSMCHKAEKGETVQSKRNRGNEDWPRLVAVANDVVEVTADVGRAVGVLYLLADLLRWN